MYTAFTISQHFLVDSAKTRFFESVSIKYVINYCVLFAVYLYAINHQWLWQSYNKFHISISSRENLVRDNKNIFNEIDDNRISGFFSTLQIFKRRYIAYIFNILCISIVDMNSKTKNGRIKRIYVYVYNIVIIMHIIAGIPISLVVDNHIIIIFV